jgi:hypothetical protein
MIAAWATPSLEVSKGAAMDEPTFQRECIKADKMAKADPAQADYWHGYRRGLHRAHFGEQFGTEVEHWEWLMLAESVDVSSAARGRGYQDGLAALSPLHSGARLESPGSTPSDLSPAPNQRQARTRKTDVSR